MKNKLFILAVTTTLVVSCNTTKKITQETTKAVEETKLTTETNLSLIEGKALYDNNCGKCHKLFDANEYTAEEWKPIVDRMQAKAKIDDNQTALVYAYLSSNAKK